MLKIERAADIVIVDAHRLNVAQRNRNRPRPLIFKLLVMKDIRLKADNLKQLSTFNANLVKEKKMFVDFGSFACKYAERQNVITKYVH